MGKEAKIGLVVVGALLIVFCGVLYQRVAKLKKTPVAVAKKDAKPSDKSNLFSSPSKLTTVVAKDDKDADISSPIDNSAKWNSQSTDEPAATAQAVTPPRASYLPTGDETATTDDRYSSRYSQGSETASDADSATPEDAALTEVANDATSPPAAISNPFARSAPPAEATEPATSEPSAIVAEEPNAAAVADPPMISAAIDESAAPARLAENAVPATAMSEASATAPSDTYSRPTSRFITPPEDQPAEAPQFGGVRPHIISERSNTARAIAGGKYTLGPNENFWTVAERAYGTGGYFKALHAYNAEKYPVADELTVGDEVVVPSKAELERQFPKLCPKPGRRPTTQSYAIQASAKVRANSNTYVVQEGDTLFDIARYELGKASRWAELYELNRDVVGDDIDFLRAGMELVLPDDNKTDSMTRQPGSALQR